MRRAHGRPNFRQRMFIHTSPHPRLGNARRRDYINLYRGSRRWKKRFALVLHLF
jgi:hypothetical protein